jgi:hypothetical protein
VKILAEEEKRRWFVTTYKSLMKKGRKFWRRWRTKGIGLPLQGKDYFQDDYRGRHARVLPTATMAQAYGLTVFVRYAEQFLFATSQAASVFAKATTDRSAFTKLEQHPQRHSRCSLGASADRQVFVAIPFLTEYSEMLEFDIHTGKVLP